MTVTDVVLYCFAVLLIVTIPFFLARSVFEALRFLWNWCFVIIGCTVLLVLANTYFNK